MIGVFKVGSTERCLRHQHSTCGHQCGRLFGSRWQPNGWEFIWGWSLCHTAQEKCLVEEACSELHGVQSQRDSWDESGNLPLRNKRVHACMVVSICQACNLHICRCSHQADTTFSQDEELCDLKISQLDTPKLSGGGQARKLWLIAGLSMQMCSVLHHQVTKLYVKSWNEKETFWEV